MSLVSLSDLISRVRRRAKLERQTKTVTDEEITDYLNEHYANLADIASSSGEQWYRDSRQFNTTAQVDTYKLRGIATNFYRLISVFVYVSGSLTSDVIVATRIMENQRAMYMSYPSWGPGWPIGYELAGDSIIFVPIPPAQILVQINYIPRLDDLSTSVQFDDQGGSWEDFLVWNATADVRGALDLDPTYAQGRAAQAEQNIREMAGRRDEGNPPVAIDIYATRRDPWL